MAEEPQDDDVVVGEDGDDTPEEETPEDNEGEGKDDKDKVRTTAIAQKKHWREKAKAEQSKVKNLEEELARLKDMVKKPTDDQEAKAQEYIRAQAREVFEQLQTERERVETKKREEVESAVESALEDNPDISKEELLETMEDLDVSAEVAVKVLQRQASKTKEKPKMPTPKRGSGETPKATPDDSKKSMWDIVKEEAGKIAK